MQDSFSVPDLMNAISVSRGVRLCQIFFFSKVYFTGKQEKLWTRLTFGKRLGSMNENPRVANTFASLHWSVFLTEDADKL